MAPISFTRPIPKLSKICRDSAAGLTPASAMRRHRSNVRAEIGPWRNPPVSVAIPRYRCAAISGVHRTPSASMRPATISAHDAADTSNQLTAPYSPLPM